MASDRMKCNQCGRAWDDDWPTDQVCGLPLRRGGQCDGRLRPSWYDHEKTATRAAAYRFGVCGKCGQEAK